jgi:hypothetical protein
MTPTVHPDIIKAGGGAALAVASYVASTVDQVPLWLREFGLPLVMLAGAIVAVVYLYKELRAERQARIADRDGFISVMRSDAENAGISRENLLRATMEQTAEFKALRRELTRDKS